MLQPTENDQEHAKALMRQGTYYKEALDWYDEKYHTPIIEKAYAIFITAIALISTFFAIKAFMDFLPVTVKMPMMLELEDLDEHVVSVFPLSDHTNESNEVLLHYLLEEYVKARENYLVDRLQADINRVRAMSSTEEFLEYRAYIAPSNPSSPLARFERNTERHIRITRVEYPPMEEHIDAETVIHPSATVYYTARLEGEEEDTSRWKARVIFEYSPFSVDQETFETTPMELTVTDYQTDKIVGR